MDAQPPDDEPGPGVDADAPSETDELPVAGPGAARRGLRVAITLLLVASLVVVFGLNLNGTRAPSAVEPQVGATFHAAGAVARIAIVDANGALTSMHADGSSIVSYQVPGVTFQLPAWSPDGTKIAAVGTGNGAAAVYVLAAPIDGTGAPTSTIVYQSPEHQPFYLYWAPNSKALAFLTNEPDGIALRYAAADASTPDTTVRTGAPMYWQWVDQTKLFVHSGGDAQGAFVGEVGLDGTLAEPTSIEAGSFRAPAFSTTGNDLAYASRGADGSALVVVESRDGKSHVEIPVFGISALNFDPTGNSLAFLAAETADAVADVPLGPLRAVDPASGTVRTLLGGGVVAFFWAPDGKTIAAIRLSGAGDTTAAAQPNATAILARAGAPAVQAGAHAVQAAAPGVVVRLAFVDVATGSVRAERTVRLSDLFVSQVLPYFDQYALSHRIWSPDASSIILPLDDDQGVSRLTLIPADGLDSRVVAAGATAFWSP